MTLAPTETTVPETTVPETTVPETEAPTEPETEPQTEAAELVLFAEETEPAETEAAQEKGSPISKGSIIGIVMIAGVLTFLLAGAMIFRGSRRNRY